MTYYAGINKEALADGPGVRVSVFLSGCHFHCPGCHNQEAQDFSYGKPFTDETVREVANLLKRPYIAGLTILGGEPLAPENLEATYALCACRRETWWKNVWIYTGYTWEKLMERVKTEPKLFYIFTLTDIIVDGRYEEDKRDLALAFRGSTNQRIIEPLSSLTWGRVILREEYMNGQ